MTSMLETHATGPLKSSRRSAWVTTNRFRGKPDAFYRCHGINSIRADRVRTIDDAARMFAHRLAVKLFGCRGCCGRIDRIGANPQAVRYRATLLGPRGLSQRAELDVWRP